jgi:hypothetical protein
MPEHPWLAHYPAGVPHEIAEVHERHLPEIFRAVAAATPTPSRSRR